MKQEIKEFQEILDILIRQTIKSIIYVYQISKSKKKTNTELQLRKVQTESP